MCQRPLHVISVTHLEYWTRSRSCCSFRRLWRGLDGVHRVGDLLVGSHLSGLPNSLTVHKHRWRTADSHLPAQVEIRLDLSFIRIGSKTAIEGIHIQLEAFCHRLQAAITEGSLVFPIPVGVENAMHLPEFALLVRAHRRVGCLV